MFEHLTRSAVKPTQILTALIASAGLARAEPIDFAHDVVPILTANCTKCHTDGTYKGKLSLDTREALVESGAAVPGDATVSEFITRLTHADPDERMPKKADPLAAKDVATLTRWVDEGLEWEPGFTFKSSDWVAPLKPRRPQLPGPDDRNPIDQIIGAYFAANKVTPPGTADDQTFLRRVHLDLIGTLPTPDEVAAFASDSSPDKRARVAAELLGRSDAYAAHWMTFWNDLLRNDYAGTGFIDGGRKQITDWLYASLRANKPYDQFVRELIDPDAASEGFIKGIKWRGQVNASQVQEVQFAQNVTQVFLGENLKCASCHDSFINSWKLADAYGMAAIVAAQPIEMHRCDKPTGEMAEPKFLFAELGAITGSTPKERLEQTAALMTSAENGRLTRTIANRLWQRLMGRGIIEPVDIMANEPWSADLIDQLAVSFSDGGFDLKKLLLLIASSDAYAASSVEPHTGTVESFVFRGPVAKRLTAEQFLDAVWQITGTTPGKADIQMPDPGGAVRASLRQSNMLMRALGRPNREQVVTTRPAELSTLQALELNNGKEFVALLEAGAKNRADLTIEQLYREALGRTPTAEELEVAGMIRAEQGVADLLWVTFMLPEFQLIR